MALTKKELRKQLEAIGIHVVEGNFVKKSEVQKIVAKDSGRFVAEKNIEEFFKMLGGLGFLVKELNKENPSSEYIVKQLNEKMALLDAWSKKAFQHT